jgi:hypothetical protein
MRKVSLFLLITVASMFGGCSDQGKQFAATTDRIAGYVGTGLVIVDQQTSTGQMAPETGVAIVTALRSVNTLNGQLVTEAKRYVDADGNLKLTGDGQTKLLAILDSSQAVINTLVNDTRVVSMAPEKREQITVITSNLSATIATLGELIKTAKLAKGVK